jgi:hypothetical protein
MHRAGFHVRRFGMKRIGALLFTLSLAALTAHAQDAAWATFVRNDLQAIHDLLRDNHPGPVDPENSRYREWLEAGFSQAAQRGASARSYGEYERALRFYTNGFQDGHIGIGREISPDEVDWPGFVVDPSPDGAAVVTHAEADSNVHVGDRVTQCDGHSVDNLMKERVDPYFWNSAIPHERGRHFDRLFQVYAHDPIGKLKSYLFSSGEVTLQWRQTSREDFARVLETGSRDPSRAPRLYQVGGVWFVSIPTFAYSSEAAVARIRALLQNLKTTLPELRKSTVVLDVRGNHGGNSSWGEEIATIIWGKDWVQRIEDSFDDTVDWRVSDPNIERMTAMIERDKKAGLTESAAHWARELDMIKAARAEGKVLARIEERPKEIKGPPPANPVTGRVFFLTDNECASACLDFADLVRRLPSVTHVGLPTSADAVYIDNTFAMLPSGLTGLGYSMKVFRNRVRKNNEWYEPAVRWPGGPMADAAVAKWVSALP